MTQDLHISDIQHQEDWENKENWFSLPHDKWFLSTNSKSIITGVDSWVKNPKYVTEANHRIEKTNRKIDLSKVEISFTTSTDLLQQYYLLRENEYKAEWDFVEYDGDENEFDKRGKIVVAVYRGMVVGGARLGISYDGMILSNEDPDNGFTYKEMCKREDIGIDLEGKKYAEISGVVIKSGFKNSRILDGILKTIIDDCRSSGVEYAFGMSTLGYNKGYKIVFKDMGVFSFVAHKVIAPKKPEYNFMDICPIVIFCNTNPSSKFY
jgi:hypothetical protein